MKAPLAASAMIVCAAIVMSCASRPDGIEPVNGLDIERYLGKWYEIARLNHRFEENLQAVTAEYSRRKDNGGLRVINRGFNVNTGEWEEAEGKAFFINDSQTGFLKVSFFGPFYGAYVIFELGDFRQDDSEYDYAFITGNSRDYLWLLARTLWLLARTPQIGARVLERFIERSEQLGFATEELIFVDHQAPFPQPGE
jgi:apolipoprotein D and lipocalin family protein